MMSIMKRMESIVVEMTREALSECGSKYNFDAEEAWCLVKEKVFSFSDIGVRGRGLGSGSGSVRGRGLGSGNAGVSKRSNTPVKKSIPLPYSGECIDSNCQALRQNNGLYTQCQILRSTDSEYCSSCEKQLVDGMPIYGTIMQRKAVGIMDYVAPNGKRPVSYHTILKKLKFTKEEAEEEAGKQNITIDPIHFEVVDRKRGRRKIEKEPKEVKEPKSKGRPKKQKKVIEISGGDEDDLFASLVANLSISDAENKSETTDNSSEIESVSESEADDKKEAKKAEAETKKAEKEAKKAEADKKKAEKEAKKAEADKKKAEKEAKKAEAEAKKAEKEAKKAEKEVKKEEAESKKAEKKVTKKVIEEEEEEEPEVVKKITQDGKKYLKSKNTGVIYDYDKYINDNEQVVVGKWNETTEKIDFTNDEESEEEYDESDDE